MSDKNYIMVASGGCEKTCDAKTLLGAKREATRWASYGQGVQIITPEGEIWEKEFWQNRNLFGWKSWKQVY